MTDPSITPEPSDDELLAIARKVQSETPFGQDPEYFGPVLRAVFRAGVATHNTEIQAAFKAGAQWFIRIDFDSDLSQEQRIERAWQTHLERVALLVPTSKETGDADAHRHVESFVDALTPMVTNRTHAYNLWNYIASDKGAIRDSLEWAWHRIAPAISTSTESDGAKAP
jgi:hypothetical protein